MRRILMVVAVVVGMMTMGVATASVAGANPPSDCYANASTGSDLNPGTQALPMATIQGCIGVVNAGATVYVEPGTYNQDQANGYDPSTGGPGANDFNIFVNKSVTIQGLDNLGHPITSAPTAATSATAPIVSADRYVPDFGASVIFVQADNVTIRGLQISGVANDVDKTLEVNGNNVTVNADAIIPSGGGDLGIYVGPQSGSTTAQTSYAFTNNTFNGVNDGYGLPSGIQTANGSGATGPVSGRVITGNSFTNLDDALSFAGPGAQPWLTAPVGTATITGNTFSSIGRRDLITFGDGGAGVGYAAPNWCGFLSSNTFDKAVFLQTASGACSNTPETWSSGSFNAIAGVYTSIQQYAINKAQPGDTIQVLPGTYNESLTIPESLTLRGANAGVAGTSARGPESIINPSPNDGTAGVFTITTADPVTINGFQSTYVGTDAGGQQSTGGLLLSIQAGNNLTYEDNVVTGSQFNNALLFDDGAAHSTITNNLFTGTTQYHDSGTGIIAAWGSPALQNSVTITGNTFNGLTEIPSSPGNPNGTPVLNINDDGGTIAGNTFNNLHEYGILIADKLANLNIAGNTFSGIYNDTPASSSNRGSGVRVFTADNSLDFAGPVNVALNTFTNMYHAVDVANDGIPADLTSGNLKVNRNSFVGPFDGTGTGTSSTDSTAINVASGTVGTLDGTCNWWGSVGGPTANQYSGSVTVSPSLFAASPLATAACGVPGAPLITSGSSVTFHPGVAGTFTVTATGTPAPTFSEVGALPLGITLNPTTGVLSGTTGVGGTFPITISATNGVSPAATQAFTLTVTSNTSTITSASSVQIAAGKKVNFTVTTGGHPAASVTESGLPGWLTLTPGTGSKAGTAKLTGVGPVVGGDYTFVIHASNGIGPDTLQSFTVHVLAISSLASASFTKSGPVTQSFTVTTTGVGAGVSLSATLGGNLAGLTFHDNGNGTATISGQPGPTDRTHLVKVIAQAGAALTTQKLAIGISN